MHIILWEFAQSDCLQLLFDVVLALYCCYCYYDYYYYYGGAVCSVPARLKWPHFGPEPDSS